MGTNRKKILLVDDNITNLTVGKNALIEKYDVFTIPSGEKLFKMLEKVIPDMILLDVEMPEMNGYDVIKGLKKQDKTANIPVIFLTAKNDDGSELQGLSLGAIDYITKPFSPPLLLKRIEVHLLVESQKRELKEYNTNLQNMVKEKTKEVVSLQNAILRTVAELVESRDSITGGHIERTERYLKILVEGMREQNFHVPEIAAWDTDILFQSAQLHDVGKIVIKDNILFKPGKLNYEEFEEMKKHTTFGVHVIEKIEESTSERIFLEHAKIFAGTHHEKWDGTGYPKGLKGSDIPLQGRLMAIVDVYDALLSERPYKKAFTHEEAVNIIKGNSGTHFDPELVVLFISVADKFAAIIHDGSK
ncbi:MAG: response regulator [Treponema sp.]|jgi:putative two-component system response regulator|nr:response regulator [Treponema sp.]